MEMNEAEKNALEFAKAVVDGFHRFDPISEHDDYVLLLKEYLESDGRLFEIYHYLLEFHPDNANDKMDQSIYYFTSLIPGPLHFDLKAEMLIDIADKDRAAFDALKLMACDMIRNNKKMPGYYANWVSDVLLGKKIPPKKIFKRRNTKRDKLIVYLVGAIEFKYGIRRTRNDATDKPSCCDIVSIAFKDGGIDLSYDAIKKICERFVKNPMG